MFKERVQVLMISYVIDVPNTAFARMASTLAKKRAFVSYRSFFPPHRLSKVGFYNLPPNI